MEYQSIVKNVVKNVSKKKMFGTTNIGVLIAMIVKMLHVFQFISLNVASEKTHRNVGCGALNIVETQ